MKFRCGCGAKYEFDITPNMARPVKFVCPACGLDSSNYVNDLVRQELGEAVPAARAPAAGSAPVPGPVSPPAAPSPRLRVQVPTQSAPAPAAEAVGEGELPVCPKHPDEYATDKCYVCQKPICPRCMELFGYLCSPLCKARAESHGLNVPVYEGQASVREARLWRRVVRVAVASCVVLAALIGVWIWWAWWGQEPKPIFAVRFPEPAYSGQSAFCATNQIVFLHGPTLARYDMAQKKEIWSRDLVDKDHVATVAADLFKKLQDANTKAYQEGGTEATFRVPSLEKLTEMEQRSEEESLDLHAHDESIWVAQPEKLVRYDWETGKAVKEMLLRPGLASTLPRGNEFLLVETDNGKPVVTHVDLTSCDVRTEDIGAEAAALAAAARNAKARGNGGPELAGLPKNAADAGKPMDPAKVAADVQRLPLPNRIALPATLSVAMNQQRALKEMDDKPGAKDAPPPEPEGFMSLIPTRTGFIEFTTKMLEEKIVQRSAMKAAPAESALDGPVSMATEAQAANDLLNEMQRANGGEMVYENHSRYRVTIRRPDVVEPWTGEVEGEPALYPLETVDVLAANKQITVLDKKNHKLWQSTLTYNVVGAPSPLDQEEAMYGLGPCVEHAGSLYVFDQGVLSAFELATGNARWRFPSVGTIGIFFGDKDAMYVNTTTESPDTLKYSRQIDLTRKAGGPIVLKVDAKTGQVLWREELGSLLNYVSGKFIFTVVSNMRDEEDPDDTSLSFMKLRRINPRNGTVMWEHFQQRAPVDIEFNHNVVRIVFKKEVQVLKFPSL